MKINLNTLEAEGTPQEIHELMELRKHVIKPEEPGQNIGVVKINSVKKKAGRPRKERPVDWVRAVELHSAGWEPDIIAAELVCSKEEIKERFEE